MDCEGSDSKKLYKVFEASKKRTKKRGELDEYFSLGTDESNSVTLTEPRHGITSGKASLQDLATVHGDGPPEELAPKRGCGSSTASPSPELIIHRAPRMRLPRRRHRRLQNDVSLALNAGLHSTPRSNSPQDKIYDGATGKDHDSSYIYAYLEEAIKKDKKRNRTHRCTRAHERGRDPDHRRPRDHSRAYDHSKDHDRIEEEDDRDHYHDRSRDLSRDRERSRNHSPDRVRSRYRSRDRDRHGSDSDQREHSPRKHHGSHGHNHRRRHHEDVPSRDQNDKATKNPTCIIDQTILIETFAKLCSSLNERVASAPPQAIPEVVRTQSHKSLQCEVESRSMSFDVDQQPVRLSSHEHSPERVLSKSRELSQEEEEQRSDRTVRHDSRTFFRALPADKYYEKPAPRYNIKLDLVPSKARDLGDSKRDHDPSPARDYERSAAGAGEREYPAYLTRSCMDQSFRRERRERRDARDYRYKDDRRYPPCRDRRDYVDDKRRCCEKTSRSFDVHRDTYPDDFKRTARSDSHTKKLFDDPRDDRERRYDDRERRYDDRRDNKYFEERDRRGTYHSSNRSRRYDRVDRLDRLERASVLSRGEEPERASEHGERESVASVADDASTLSGRSHCLRSVKQEIFEQRDAMDNMMKLWKELMRCFKSLAQTQANPSDGGKAIHDSAATMQESAEAQLRLWRECMHRYETVARDVGDTDARLMEEITKQRSEMAEMSTMWQECLQRYRDMSIEFNTLKRQLVNEAPSRQPAAPPPAAPAPPARPAHDADTPGFTTPYRMDYPLPSHLPPMAPGFPSETSPQRSRSVAPPPPPWWWAREPRRRRSSPDSRDSAPRNTPRLSPRRDKDHERRHHRKERDEPRYKKSSSKHTASRSEHKHRKQ